MSTYFLLLAGFRLPHWRRCCCAGFRLNHCPVNNLYEATDLCHVDHRGAVSGGGAVGAVAVSGGVCFAGAVCHRGLCADAGAAMPSQSARPEVPVAWTSVHAALLSLSYGAFGLSAVAALMFLTQERNLKFHRLKAIFSLLPPIQRLEAAVGRLLVGGFILLTVGLALGAFDLAHLNNPQTYRGDPKIVWSVVVWVLYLGLIVMRWKFAQGGRRFALGAIASFVFVLLTFWGTNCCPRCITHDAKFASQTSSTEMMPIPHAADRCFLHRGSRFSCLRISPVAPRSSYFALRTSALRTSYMPIVVIGLSHHSSPVTVRERFAFAEARMPAALQVAARLGRRGGGGDPLHLQPGGDLRRHLAWNRPAPSPRSRNSWSPATITATR